MSFHCCITRSLRAWSISSSLPLIGVVFAKELLMFHWFWRLLYEANPAEFRSAFGLAESVERLQAATKRSVFSSLGETAAVGKVSEEGVRLQRVIPMMRNSFKPFFVGHFEVRAGVTVLTGRFTMALFAKIFMSFWFGMTFVFAIGALFASFRASAPLRSLWVFQPFLMLGFGIAPVVFGKWLSRNDAAWLSQIIDSALGGSKKVSAATKPPANADPDAVPGTLKVVAIVVAVSGALQALGHFLSFQFGN